MLKSKIFFLNGKKYRTGDNITILELICYLNYENNLFVLEHNGSILGKKVWHKTKIQNQDKFEILTIVGGG